MAILAALLAVACIAGLVVGAISLDQRDGNTTGAREDEASDEPTPVDPRLDAIRGFCDDPRPLTEPGPIAPFTPGQGTIALVQVPEAASSTQPAADVVVQVSPEIGTPDLTLEGSVNLLSLAVCVDPAGSSATKGTCEYELTNEASFGERRSARLRQTTYRISLRELRTGKALATGTLDTAVDSCPDLAFVEPGKGVSNSLTKEQVLFWVGAHLVNGQPG